MIFDDKFNHFLNLINTNLNYYIEKYVDKSFVEPIKYSVNAGGKRVRPIFLLATFSNFSKNIDDALPFASAIEFIHTYSLIHDDLPAIDNDDLRRGLPTSHIKFGEATAILTGDALLNLAFEIMIEHSKQNLNLNNLNAIAQISKASGTRGMISGQMADILAENSSISKEQLFFIYENKTAKLIIASFLAGAILADVDDSTISKIYSLAYDIGIAFQIKDDILDITSTSSTLGKPINSDLKNNKSTFVSLYGLQHSLKYYNELSSSILCKLSDLKFKDDFLFNFIKLLINRKK